MVVRCVLPLEASSILVELLLAMASSRHHKEQAAIRCCPICLGNGQH